MKPYYYVILCYVYSLLFLVILLIFLFKNKKNNKEIKKQIIPIEASNHELINQAITKEFKIKEKQFKLLEQKYTEYADSFKILEDNFKKKENELKFVIEELDNRSKLLKDIEFKTSKAKEFQETEQNKLRLIEQDNKKEKENLKIINSEINILKSNEEELNSSIKKVTNIIKKVEKEKSEKLNKLQINQKNISLSKIHLMQYSLDQINEFEILLKKLNKEKDDISSNIISFCKEIASIPISVPIIYPLKNTFSNKLNNAKKEILQYLPVYKDKENYFDAIFKNIEKKYLNKIFNEHIYSILELIIVDKYIEFIKINDKILSNELRESYFKNNKIKIINEQFFKIFNQRVNLIKATVYKQVIPNIGKWTSCTTINNMILENTQLKIENMCGWQLQQDFSPITNETFNYLAVDFGKYCYNTVLKEKNHQVKKLEKKINLLLDEDTKESIINKTNTINKNINELIHTSNDLENKIEIDSKKINDYNNKMIALNNQKQEINEKIADLNNKIIYSNNKIVNLK